MAKSETKVKRGRKLPWADDAKITFLNDAEGKPYGRSNNPKRAGSKSAERFALLRSGITVAGALAAGFTVADLHWDTDHKYIEISAA